MAHSAACRLTLGLVVTLVSTTPVFAADEDALRVVRDPITGQLRAPTREEHEALQAREGRDAKAHQDNAAAARARAATGPSMAVETRPNGSRRMVLGESSMTFSVVSRRPDGTLGGLQCVTGAKAAEAAVSGPKFGAAVLTGEAAHADR